MCRAFLHWYFFLRFGILSAEAAGIARRFQPPDAAARKVGYVSIIDYFYQKNKNQFIHPINTERKDPGWILRFTCLYRYSAAKAA